MALLSKYTNRAVEFRCVSWWLPEVNRELVQNVAKIYARNCRQVSEGALPRTTQHLLVTAIEQLAGREKRHNNNQV